MDSRLNRVGTVFVIFKGKTPCLLCEVLEVNATSYQCNVINGGWRFELLPNYTMRFPWDDRQPEQVYGVLIHRNLNHGDYNDALCEADRLLHRPRIVTWASDLISPHIDQVSRFWNRLTKACWCAKEAFKLSWNPRKPGERMGEYEAFHDDIPF